MKKLFTLLALIATTAIFAQAPQGFNYQATVRNSSGALIVNQNVNFKFNIMLNSQTSVPIFSETHFAPTDDLGQVNLVIGTGTATTGTFSSINWGTGNYFLGIELNTGSGYVAMGTTQLLSVPYALYANSSGNTPSISKTSIYLTGNITDAQAAAKIAAEFGPNTENIYIRNTTQLTTVDLSALTTAVKIEILHNVALTNVNFSGLTTVLDRFYVFDNTLLNLALPLLTDCYGISVGTISSLNLSSLMYTGELTVGNITNFTLPSNLIRCEMLFISEMNNLSILNFSSLDSNIYNFQISNNPLLTSISFPLITSISVYSEISGNPSLTSISFPALTNAPSFSVSNNALLTSISFPVLTSNSGIYLQFNALTTTSINSLLHKMLTVSPTVLKNIFMNGQNPPAPPTGQGIIDKQTLINAGNSVFTD
jgi:hypothetical protein